MLGKTHRIGGISTGLILSSTLYTFTSPEVSGPITIASIMAGSVVGSLLPDIDHPRSIISQKLRLLSKIVTSIFAHRGFTHTLLSMCLVTFLGALGSSYMPESIQKYALTFIIGLFFGYGNHLFLDSLTPLGIPLLYPFVRKPFRLAKVTVGEHELAISISIIIVTALYIWLLITFAPIIQSILI